MNTDHIISGIHNYCDRWCERCAFIDRCTMGVIEQKRWAKGSNWKPEHFIEELEKLYPVSCDKMAKWLEENEIYLRDMEQVDSREPDLKTKGWEEQIRRYASNYAIPLKTFLEVNNDHLKARGIDLFRDGNHYEGRDTHERSALAEAVDVIMWFQHLMFVKAGRAVGGLAEMNDGGIWGHSSQCDANGSAKVAMIAAERSVGAWEMLRRHWPEKQGEVQPFIQEINELRQLIEQIFPDWRTFIRPGFDTEKPDTLPFGEN